MNHRVVLRLSSLALVALAAGCSDDLPSEPESGVLTISPLFTSVAEGDSIQLTASVDAEPVDVTWESSDESIATVDANGWVRGVSGGFTAITASLVSAPQRIRSANITIIPIPEIFSDDPVSSISSAGARGSQSFYKIDVPAGTTNLTVTLSGGTGDVDLYIQHGSRPTYDTADCWSFNGGNTEECSVDNPAAGMWFIMLDLWDPYSGVTLEATITP